MKIESDNKYKINFLDIVKGVIFSILLLVTGYLLDNSSIQTLPIFHFLYKNISNPYVLFSLFIVFVIIYAIIGSLCGVLATANVFGLHRHSFFKQIWPQRTKEQTQGMKEKISKSDN